LSDFSENETETMELWRVSKSPTPTTSYATLLPVSSLYNNFYFWLYLFLQTKLSNVCYFDDLS
jgi:hypothetical protein